MCFLFSFTPFFFTIEKTTTTQNNNLYRRSEAVGKEEESSKSCALSFLRSPVEVLADESTGRTRGIRMEINKLEASTSFVLLASPFQFFILCNVLLFMV